MSDYQVTIRLLEDQSGFAFTVEQNGRLIDFGAVDTGGEVTPGYYGGSEVMD